ncbi:MAG: secretin N-terminal domain-containing protein [Candidatus Omnitrophota bacterium]
MAKRYLDRAVAAILFLALVAGSPLVGICAEADMMITETGNNTISLDLRGIEITEFLKVLSKKLKMNIIPSKNVSGRISIFLNDITYKDALDVVILSQGLAYEKKNADIIMVMTDVEYEALYGEKFYEKKKIETVKLNYAPPSTIFTVLDSLRSSIGSIIIDSLTGTLILMDTPEKLKVMIDTIAQLDKPPITEIFELQYAKAPDIRDKVAAIATEGASEVLVDDRTNSLIVMDLPGNMNNVKQAIAMLDQETMQVFIEAEILEIALRDRLQSGINWDRILSDHLAEFALSGIFPSALGTALVGTFLWDKEGVDMQFLQNIGDAKTLSSPRIAVTNNEEATILIGTREAYVTGTTSQSGDSTITSDTVEFVDVGVKLKVVPTINRDGYIIMKIKPEISSVTRTLTTGTTADPRSQIPIIQTSEAETTVKVKDGYTIFIAGFRQNLDRDDRDGMPFITKIPILNILFSRRDRDQLQSEIIIFLTPHIISGGELKKWDKDQMKKYPAYTRPENKGYVAEKPEFHIENLKTPGESER